MEYIDLEKMSVTSAPIRAVTEFLRTHDLATFTDGRHDIEGDNFYCNIFQYQTATPEERIWEAHREFVDIHYVLEGAEFVHHAFLHHAQCGEYQTDKDYLPIHTANVDTRIFLQPHQLLVFYPEDAHQTGIKNDEPLFIRKAVFKWSLQNMEVKR